MRIRGLPQALSLAALTVGTLEVTGAATFAATVTATTSITTPQVIGTLPNGLTLRAEGGGAYWVLDTAGAWKPGLDNAYDIGGNSNRVSIFYGVYGNFSGYVAGGQLRVTGIGGIYPGATSGVLLLTNATEDGFSRLCFGGTTSSFPALRRAGAALEAVKADESDYATFRCSAIRDANNVQVLGAQGAAVADASGGATVDAEARTAINTLLARARAHGLIST